MAWSPRPEERSALVSELEAQRRKLGLTKAGLAGRLALPAISYHNLVNKPTRTKLTEEQWERLRAWLQQTEVQQFQVGLHLLTHLKAQYVRAAKSPIVASDTAVQLLIHAAVVLRRQLEAQGIQSVLTVSSRRITLALTEGLRIPATLVVFGAEIPCVECLTGDREKPDCTLPLDENTWRHIMDFFSTLRDQGAPVLLPTAENVANLFRS